MPYQINKYIFSGRSFRLSLVTLFFFISVIYNQSFSAADTVENINSTFFEKLYRFLWPDQKFNGDLALAIQRTTGKSSDTAANTQLLVVNSKTGQVSSVVNANDSQDATICPDTSTLLYRRGGLLVKETIQIKAGQLESVQAPKFINNVKIHRLFACIYIENKQPYALVRTINGEIQQIPINEARNKHENEIKDINLAGSFNSTTASYLRSLGSMRPDGSYVFVVNKRLVGVLKPSSQKQLLTREKYHFIGNPVWVGNSPLVLVNAKSNN